mmetsp:Transcript_42059/g.75839  ORF Transcript_42059/g.75839 Transcript_42059/m.75839 type:complete len:664 (-) Transcript_42059:297-2288(-)
MVYVVAGEIKPGHRPRSSDDGAYKRQATVFRQTTPLSCTDEGTPALGRYHLIVSAACPWAHRTLIMCKLKQLEAYVTVSVVLPQQDDDIGWEFAEANASPSTGGAEPTPDLATGKSFRRLSDVYLLADPKYTGNITTPVLYDSQEQRIINNDSADIVKIFDAWLPASTDIPTLYPEEQRKEIDEVKDRIQQQLNNGVYQAGLAKTQTAYLEAVEMVFSCLDALEQRLQSHRYLLGSTMTIADVQLFPTLVRFDAVYYPLFKCSRKRLVSYHHISAYMRDMYQTGGVAVTVDMEQIRLHYFSTFTSINPKGIVSIGSDDEETFGSPHERASMIVVEEEEKVSHMAAVEDEHAAEAAARRARGEFVRGVSAFRQGVSKEDATPGRYHLYIANNCPWCHRVMLARSVLGLEAVISVDICFYRRHPERGWQFLPADDELYEHEVAAKDTLLSTVSRSNSVSAFSGHPYVAQVYAAEGSTEKSVPILFDKQDMKIVNNESAEIIRIFNDGFRHLSSLPNPPDLYPPSLAPVIDSLNDLIYPAINNGAYKAGFTSSEEAYKTAFHRYFDALSFLNERLRDSRFLTGNQVTEADLRLFPTLVRHDPVYYIRMRLNKRMIADYPFLSRWLHDFLRQPGVKEATDLEHCRNGYFGRTGNNIIPMPLSDSHWY